MIVPRSSRRAPQLGRVAWLVLATALAPGLAVAMDRFAEVALREPLADVAAGVEEAEAEAGATAAVTATVPAPATAPEPAPGTAPEPAAATATEPAPTAPADAKPETPAPPTNPLSPGSLNFDLLGTEAAQVKVDEDALRLRRTMLNVHQGMGLVLIALQLATTVVGQLNYSDRFYGPSTGKYQQPHAVLAYSTLAVFGATALVAMLAPSSPKKSEGVDRVTTHKVAMYTALGGMIAEGFLGVYAHNREGHIDQKSVATTHLVIGYATLAAMVVGVGAIMF